MQNKLLLIAVITASILFSCKKEEPEVETPVLDPPECEISISGGQSEFNYGDTVFIDCQATANPQYLNRVRLLLNENELYSTRDLSFSFELVTSTIETGQYNLKLVVYDTRDTTGVDSENISIVAILPTVLTHEALYVGTDSATILGEFISAGGSPATWGLCYNTSGNPTKVENTFNTSEKSFSLKLSGLQKLTTYYVRGWATNDVGTQYGETKEFKTTDESGTFVDFRDDHVYRWVKIGEQVWMADNLAYLPFLSDPLNNPTKDSNIWVYGYAGMDVEEAKQTENYHDIGALYSWTMAKNLCPTGWHLPDTNEYNELFNYLGGIEVAGDKLRERGTEHWVAPNEGATNESGFNGIAGGIFWPGSGGGITRWVGFYWSSSTSPANYNNEMGTSYELSSVLSKVTIDAARKKAGLSVRCVKD